MLCMFVHCCVNISAAKLTPIISPICWEGKDRFSKDLSAQDIFLDLEV